MSIIGPFPKCLCVYAKLSTNILLSTDVLIALAYYGYIRVHLNVHIGIKLSNLTFSLTVRKGETQERKSKVTSIEAVSKI